MSLRPIGPAPKYRFSPPALGRPDRRAYPAPVSIFIIVGRTRSSQGHLMRSYPVLLSIALLTVAGGRRPVAAQEPAAWGTPTRDALEFHTFSIAAIDPRTGEVGVAVTTRVPCVGNGVPWVRAGVGAVATQANTRTEYGQILLDALAKGDEPARALDRALAADSQAISRQIGVIAVNGALKEREWPCLRR